MVVGEGEENEGNAMEGAGAEENAGNQGHPIYPMWVCVRVNGIASPLLIHRQQPMAWFKYSVAGMLNLPLWELRFFIGDRFIHNLDTPESLNLQDNDLILVIHVVQLHHPPIPYNPNPPVTGY